MSNKKSDRDTEHVGKMVVVGISWAAWNGQPLRSLFLEVEDISAGNEHHTQLYKQLRAAVLEKSATYNVRESLPTNYGRSFILTPPEGSSLPKMFLKLAADPLDEHIGFSEEIENLREINTLETEMPNGDSPLRVGHVARVISRATLHDGNCSSPALLEEYIDGSAIDSLFPSERRSMIIDPSLKQKSFLEVMGPLKAEKASSVWLILAFTLTNIVRRLHNHGIIHGWIQPRHVILGKAWNSVRTTEITAKYCRMLMNDIHLVGFGTSALLFDTDRVAVVRLAMDTNKSAAIYAATEVEELGRVEGLFSYPVDLYSVGMTLLMVALGMNLDGHSKNINAQLEELLKNIKSAETVWQLKRKVSSAMAEAGWPSESFARVIDKALRKDQADRYLCAEEMLQFILNAAAPETRQMLLDALLDTDDVKNPLSDIMESMAILTNSQSPSTAGVAKRTSTTRRRGSTRTTSCKDFLPDFFQNRLRESIIWEGLSARNGHLEFYGSRDVLLESLCSFMGLLKKDDEYCTRTFPAYWTDTNLGVDGRFLVMNKDLAKNGVKVRRLFMVAYDFHELPIDEQMVLLAQREACLDVWKRLGNASERANYSVRVRKVGGFRELLKGERRKQFVAYVKFGETSDWKGQYVGFSFMSYGKPFKYFKQEHHRMQITKLRFRQFNSDKGDERSLKAFDTATDWSNPDSDDNLEKYLNSGTTLKALLSMSNTDVGKTR